MGLRAESSRAARTRCVTFEVATRIEWFGKFKKLIHAPHAMEKPHESCLLQGRKRTSAGVVDWSRGVGNGAEPSSAAAAWQDPTFGQAHFCPTNPPTNDTEGANCHVTEELPATIGQNAHYYTTC